MQSFDEILARAVARHGGAAEVEAALPQARTARALARLTDDRWLAEMTRSVFRAGFRWKVVDAKWAGFEEAFHGFDTMACAMLSDEDLEALQADTRIIRNGPKIRTVRDNAIFVRQLKDEYGSFARCVADWPGTDIVGLWMLMKARGSRLGGMSGPMTLRSLGKDSFLLTGDVTRALVGAGVVDRPPTGKRALAEVQAAFNAWHDETGRPLCQLSRILAMSV
ncbi:MAG TPA: DNA-3-methyladenine glycosylase I [Pseudomonadales bacterium]|nr:DNA-3-methyladenine glycosylase I [Pseudomonadales bacterium]